MPSEYEELNRRLDEISKTLELLPEIKLEQTTAREEINYILRETFGDDRGSGNWGFGQRIQSNTDRVEELEKNKLDKSDFNDFKNNADVRAGTVGGGGAGIVFIIIEIVKVMVGR